MGLLLLEVLYLWQRTTFPLWMVDLFHIQYAAFEWRAGEPEWMYAPADKYEMWVAHREPVARELGAEGYANAYFYPPFLAAVLAPFSHVPATVWRNVVFAINVVLLFGFAYLIARLSSAHVTWRGLWWALALVLWCYPMSRAAKLGQIVPLLAVLTWTGLLWLQNGKQKASGILLGVVSAIRIFPFGLVLIPLFSRRWRVVAVWSGTVIAIYALSFALMGMAVHRYWWEAMSEFGTHVYAFFGNQSPTGWIARLSGGGMENMIPYRTPLLHAFGIAGTAIFTGGSGWMLWRKRERLDSSAYPAAVGLMTAGIILGMPNSWEHYWLFVLPALGWAIYQSWEFGDRGFWKAWLACAAFFFLMKLTHFYGASALERIATGSQTLGMLMMWVWFARRTMTMPAEAKALA